MDIGWVWNRDLKSMMFSGKEKVLLRILYIALINKVTIALSPGPFEKLEPWNEAMDLI